MLGTGLPGAEVVGMRFAIAGKNRMSVFYWAVETAKAFIAGVKSLYCYIHVCMHKVVV